MNDNWIPDYEILQTSRQWMNQFDHQILDPDGWRTNSIYGETFEPCDFEATPITKHEYFRRKIISTCMITGQYND